jgi:DNA-binding NarL/FixJ family response regulator
LKDKLPSPLRVLGLIRTELLLREVLAEEAMKSGARGVVLKQSVSDLLLKSIRKVHDGEIWLDNRTTAEVIHVFKKSAEAGQRPEKPLLSDREKEIAQLVAQEFRNRAIGEKLFISEQTGENHLHNIFDKLGMSDRLELALYAIHID